MNDSKVVALKNRAGVYGMTKIIFYGKLLDSDLWAISESVWKKEGKVLLFVDGKWEEVDPGTQFHINGGL